MGKRDYRSSVKEHMEEVEEFLKGKYGEIPPAFNLQLEMLEDTMLLRGQIMDSIRQRGIIDEDTGKVNPLLSVLKDKESILMKISQKLGISPWDDSKINQPAEDDTNDFLDKMVGRPQLSMEFPE